MGQVDPTIAGGDEAAKNTQKQLEASAGLKVEAAAGETVITAGTTPKVETAAGGENVVYADSNGTTIAPVGVSAPITTNEQPPSEGAGAEGAIAPTAEPEKKATPTSTLHTPQA